MAQEPICFQLRATGAVTLKCVKGSFSRKGLLFAKRTFIFAKRTFIMTKLFIRIIYDI